MECLCSVRFRGWISVFGTLLMMIPLGLPYYWGNVSVYVLSYMRVRLRSTAALEAPWVIFLYSCGQSIGFILVGIISKRTGRRIGLLCGIVLFLGGFFSTYFTINTSIVWVNVTVGVISGVGCGFVNGMALEYAVPWAGRHIGVVTLVVQNGCVGGSILLDEFVSLYVNPHNKSPDLTYQHSLYFSQDDVLDNVPSLFIVFGCICSVFQVLGFFMVREFQDDPSEMEPIWQPKKQQHDNDDSIEKQPETETTPKHKKEGDKSPRQMIKKLPFFTLSLACMLHTMSILTITNYYKLYGEIWIKDDHFFSHLGTVYAASGVFFGPIWGTISDRIGVKMASIVMYATSTVFIFILYFSPGISQWLYFVAMTLYASSACNTFAILVTATCMIFGQTHHSSNVGVVASSNIVMVFVSPLIVGNVLSSLGWFYVFLLSACYNCVCILGIVFTLDSI